MRTGIVAGTLVLALAGCNGGEKDETADLQGVRLTREQKGTFDADGLRPGMTTAQVTKAVLQRHPDAQYDGRPSWKTVYTFGPVTADGYQDQVTIDVNDGLAVYPVYQVTVERHFAKGGG